MEGGELGLQGGNLGLLGGARLAGGLHVAERLTDAVILLGRAKDSVSNFVDGIKK